MLKRKSSTDSENSAKTPRLENEHKYVKLSDVLPDYSSLLFNYSSCNHNNTNSTTHMTEESSDSCPLLTQVNGVTSGVFLPSPFLEFFMSHLESLGPQVLDETSENLKKIIGKILSYKSYDIESEGISRKSSIDSTDLMNRGHIRPEFESLSVGQPTQNLQDICADYANVMEMRPQLTANSETQFNQANPPNSTNGDKNQNTSEDSEMSEGTNPRGRRGSYAGQKGIYGSYARKIEAIHKRNEEDIKNILEATYLKPNGTDSAVNKTLNYHQSLLNEEKLNTDVTLTNPLMNSQHRVSNIPHAYNMVSNGMVQAVPVMHTGPLQYFIHLPVAQGSYLPQNEIEKTQNANCACIPNPGFTYPPMQFLHISPFISQSGNIGSNIKQEERSKDAVSPEVMLPTSE